MIATDFDVILNDNKKINDFISNQELEPTPEEFVRQKFLRILHFEYQYPKDFMRREVAIYYGHQELKDSSGRTIRADIVVYNSKRACLAKDQGNIAFIIECKAPNVTEGYNQLVSYIYNTSASGGVWFSSYGDEDKINYYRRISEPNNELIPWIGLPKKGERWDALGRIDKNNLKRPKDIKGLLRRCHNKLHGRGFEGDEEDLTMDMVRIILAKAMDEEKDTNLPEFYCSSEEYNDENGRNRVAERIQALFKEAKAFNPQVFSEHEEITVGARAICDVVIELQSYQLLSNFANSDDWDIMGYAYEQYTASYLKRQKGQFFTNRLIIDFLVKALEPQYSDIILDPAGGSGGFLTGVMRYVRKKILEGSSGKIAKERQLDRHRKRLFMVEINKRLVKVAKTAMILNGDGHAGMTQGDSLGDYSNFEKTIIAECTKETPTIILTNPPFAGTGEGRITQLEVLQRFECAKKRSVVGENPANNDEIMSDGVPPEMLFFERCIDWLAPNGKLGIVMPKSFLDTQTYLPLRKILFSKCQLLAVINCHKNTFQPHTGVRTCLILARKYNQEETPLEDYKIFMAISNKVGQDSEGVPIYKTDDKTGKAIDELDHDLDEILNSYTEFKKDNFQDSAYHFSVNFSQLNEQLNINPQWFLPSFNETIKQIESIDGLRNWSVMSLFQIDRNIKIYKGPWFKSENLIVERKNNEFTEKYYTPSAILQEKSDSAKLVDLSKATKNQLKIIETIRLYKGDIVITRSGTIGRVSYITSKHDRAIVSDDLIRLRIEDENLRLYVYYFLQTIFGQAQMLRNEYGTVQQHLEPQHIKGLLVPVPDDWSEVQPLLKKIKKIIYLQETIHQLSTEAYEDISYTTSRLIAEASLMQPSPEHYQQEVLSSFTIEDNKIISGILAKSQDKS
ncbi:type I restriction modification system, N-6 DNA Methylase [Nostoc carneum NIES-2107]|nr:type I restriction modification system, N-6 DNA Methylase [Nostoc carneum NIES-2107]